MNNIKPMSKQSLYSKVSSYSPKIINRLVELVDSSNESVALGACKALLNKSIPDLKAIGVFNGDAEVPNNTVYLPKKIQLEKPNSL